MKCTADGVGKEKGYHGIWAGARKMGKRQECKGCVGKGHPEGGEYRET